MHLVRGSAGGSCEHADLPQAVRLGQVGEGRAGWTHVKASGDTAGDRPAYPAGTPSGPGHRPAALLLDPGSASERVLVAGGAERLSYPVLARLISEVAGLPVRYEELIPDAWHGETCRSLSVLS